MKLRPKNIRHTVSLSSLIPQEEIDKVIASMPPPPHPEKDFTILRQVVELLPKELEAFHEEFTNCIILDHYGIGECLAFGCVNSDSYTFNTIEGNRRRGFVKDIPLTSTPEEIAAWIVKACAAL
jgi:hypothetical protein